MKELVRSIADALDKIPRARLEQASGEESLPAAIEVDHSRQHSAEDRNS